MARQLKRLTARTVAALKSCGRHADGQNLYLTISNPSTSSGGGGVSKRWTFMYSFAGKQREAGFGPAATVTLAEAREKATGYRSMLAKGNLTRWPQRRPPGKPRPGVEPSANAPPSLSNPSHPSGATKSIGRNGRTRCTITAGRFMISRLTQSTRKPCLASCNRFGAGFQKPRHGFAAGSRQS